MSFNIEWTNADALTPKQFTVYESVPVTYSTTTAPFGDLQREVRAGSSRSELLPCPFCGWNGIHMRKKTQMRESVTGLTYMRGYDQFDPYSLGYAGQDFREDHCYDYRFGVRFFCGKCKAETPYVWGEWHLPTEDEVETFDDLPHACERFDPYEERETIGKAIAAWNRRTDHD